MNNLFIRTAVRSLFAMTSRDRALKQARIHLQNYLRLADELGCEAGTRAVKVPPMPGVDEDMRNWPYYMILEHNTIVNRVMTAIVQRLVRSEPLSGAAAINPKKDVMPSPSAGEECVQAFHDSVTDHIDIVSALDSGLRGSATTPHPVFGDFDAHKWNCMFSFHLGIHYKQAEYVVGVAR